MCLATFQYLCHYHYSYLTSSDRNIHTGTYIHCSTLLLSYGKRYRNCLVLLAHLGDILRADLVNLQHFWLSKFTAVKSKGYRYIYSRTLHSWTFQEQFLRTIALKYLSNFTFINCIWADLEHFKSSSCPVLDPCSWIMKELFLDLYLNFRRGRLIWASGNIFLAKWHSKMQG